MEVRSKRLKPPAGERPLFQGTADQVIGDIRAYATAGVTHFVWDFTTQDLRHVLENLERFAQEVRPKLVGGRRQRTVGAGAVRSGRTGGGLAGGARGSARVVARRGAAGAVDRRGSARVVDRRGSARASGHRKAARSSPRRKGGR
jgi:hypothetical protein